MDTRQSDMIDGRGDAPRLLHEEREDDTEVNWDRLAAWDATQVVA